MAGPTQRDEGRDASVVAAVRASLAADASHSHSRSPAVSSSTQQAVDPDALPPLPPRIGRFTVLHPLGSGGMGMVCAAYDAELDRKVAIKLLRPQATSGKSSLGQARLLREAQAMARLAHPNVVTVHEVGTHGDQVFIAMEFLVGITLKHWLRRARRPWPEVLAVFLQAGRGLAAAHAAGLIHRDFKPDNVMVTEEPRTRKVERVRVFDFGVVQESREAALRQSSQALMRTPNPANPDAPRRVNTPEPRMDRSGEELDRLRRSFSRSLPLQSEPTPSQESQETPPSTHPESSSLHGDDNIYTTGLTAAGALVGTPLYMAPEQYDQAADARSDQFSFCAALYEGLYRRRPFGGDTAARLQQAKLAGQIRRPPKNHDIPPWLHRIVVRGLSSQPSRRFASMEALLTELGREQARRKPLAIAAVAAALGLVGLGASMTWALVRAAPDPCERAASSLSSVWSPTRREQVHAAFRGSGRPYAETAWTTVDARIDAYTRAWAGQRRALCRASSDPHEGLQLAMRGLCLEQRREELGALVDLLAHADGEVVDNAVQAASQLQSVATCEQPAADLSRAPLPGPDIEVRARELEHRVAELRALEQTGKYAAGLDLAGSVVSDARELGHPPLIAEALFWHGLLHSRVSASKLAEAALREALLLAEESRHDPIVARAATELVRVVGVDQERHAEGMLWSDLAGASLRRLEDEPGEVTWRGYLGHLYEVRGDLRAAQTEYSQALEQARKIFREEHPQLATALDDLAGMQLKQGDHGAAQANYEKVLQIRQRTQGPGHPRVAEALGHLGRVAAEQGQHERARGLFEQALGICDVLRACSPADRAEALVNFGRSEAAAGRHAAAQRLHEEALRLLEGLYGREHGKIVDLLLALGGFARDQARHDEAAGHYQRALTIQRRLHAEDHPAMAAIHVSLGALALARGRLDEARGALERALEIHERHGGFENFALAEILDHLGVVARAQGRTIDAMTLHARARQILRRNLGEAHPDVIRVTLHLGEAQLERGETVVAEATLDASLRAQEQAAAAPVSLARTRFLLARVLAADSHGPDAALRHQRSRALAESALAAERLVGHGPLVDEISAWLRAQPRIAQSGAVKTGRTR